jgi:hypothetical protein
MRQKEEEEKKHNTDRERKQALYTEEKENTEKQMKNYFLVARADDDRPVSVPVWSCCLELFDAVCGGCI